MSPLYGSTTQSTSNNIPWYGGATTTTAGSISTQPWTTVTLTGSSIWFTTETNEEILSKENKRLSKLVKDLEDEITSLRRIIES